MQQIVQFTIFDLFHKQWITVIIKYYLYKSNLILLEFVQNRLGICWSHCNGKFETTVKSGTRSHVTKMYEFLTKFVSCNFFFEIHKELNNIIRLLFLKIMTNNCFWVATHNGAEVTENGFNHR